MKSNGRRILAISLVLAAWALLLIVRLYLVQVVHGAEYGRDALGQYVAEAPDAQNRGSIFFTTKDNRTVAAALTESGWRLAIIPKDIKNATSTLTAIQSVASIDESNFLTRAAKTNDPYEEVATRLSDSQAQSLRSLKLSGTLLVQDRWRTYPHNSLAAQIIGFVGYEGNDRVGTYGIERQYEKTLEAHHDNYVNPFAELFANMQSVITPNPTEDNGDIVTTIEPSLQQKLEDVLTTVSASYTPKIAGGIIMDPHTGEIRAMALHPTFDPNEYNKVTDPAVFDNPLITGRYELGSIMKALTMAVGLDTGSVTPETKYNDVGCITRNGKKICNFDQKARGVVNMQEVLNQSLNLGATYVAEKVGVETFTKYFEAFGLGNATGIDLPSEVSGDLNALHSGTDVDLASASFGRGIATSPIEMTRALAVLANGGILPHPHIVSSIRLENGVQRSIAVPDGTRVLKTETVDTITNMLFRYVENPLAKV